MIATSPQKITILFQRIKARFRERRRKKRYAVSWDGMLELCFPDFQKQIKVAVGDFSGSGVRLCAEQIYLDERRMIVSNPMPKLNLKIFLPDGGIFESEITIHWYSWSVEKCLFEIGTAFKNLSEEKKSVIDNLTEQLRCQHFAKAEIRRDLTSPLL